MEMLSLPLSAQRLSRNLPAGWSYFSEANGNSLRGANFSWGDANAKELQRKRNQSNESANMPKSMGFFDMHGNWWNGLTTGIRQMPTLDL